MPQLWLEYFEGFVRLARAQSMPGGSQLREDLWRRLLDLAKDLLD